MAERQPTPRFSVRAPAPGDVRTLERLEQICFSDPWPGHLLLAEVYAPGRFHRVLTSEGGEILAYLLAAWQYLDLHILKIATRPEFRRRGLAAFLIELAKRHAEVFAGESVTLEVRVSNTGAIALYQELHFQEVGRRPGYYGDGEDALIMTWRPEDSPGARAPLVNRLDRR